jgi:hypothetical protein
MKLRLGVVLALLVPAVACRAPEKPKPPPNPPAITSFTVDKQAIRRGESVTFNFTLERAESVELVDQTGSPVALTYDDRAGVGSAKASPERSAFYVLRAEGEGGRDAAFVQVAVDEGLQSVFLVVVPQQIKPGQRVDLIWSAAGGRNVRLAAGARMLSMLESGTTTDSPMTTTTYTLSGERADGSLSSQSATVTVVPVVESFTATPPAAKPGETITLAWKTAGADQVTVDEATFGQLVSTSMNVAMGTVDFVVPTYFADAGFFDAGTPSEADGGTDGGLVAPPVPVVREGFPLRFTLTARSSTPLQQVQRAVDARVGQGPAIDFFEVPAFGTRGKPFTLSWRTTGATRVELKANGLPLYSPLAGDNATGSFRLGNFSADTSFTLVAYDLNGLQVSSTKAVKAVAPPRIISFMAPLSTTAASVRVTVTWTTADANFLLLRLKGGPAFLREDGVNAVVNGTTQFTVPQKGTYVLEAYNTAGDKAVEERTIDVGAPVAFAISPELLARGELTSMTWDVGTVAPTDIMGLIGPPPAAAANANAFDDLSTAPTARRLFFADSDDDVATITLPHGFVFPFATKQANTLTVSINGFVAIAGAAPSLPTNADLGDIGYAGPPVLAPFWDNLELGVDGRVLWNIDETSTPRRLTISWHKLKRYGVMGSELTFQVQLFETGKFIFVWKKLDGPGADGSEATIGAVDAVDAYQGLVSYNSATSAELAVDTERVWFAGSNEFSGTRQVRVRVPSVLGFVVETATERIPVFGKVRAFGPNDIVITEAMPAPLTSLTSGQWVEFQNPGERDLDVGGLRFESVSRAMSSFVLPANTTITAGGFFVAGQSTDSALNGDAGVRLAWTAGSVGLTTPDSVRLVIPTPLSDGGTLVLSRLAWGGISSTLADGGLAPDGGVDVGASVQPPENVLVPSGTPPFTCQRALRFGSQIGTPGSTNETCFDYVLTEIPVDFEEIGGSPLPLIASSFIFDPEDEGYAVVRSDRGVSYFGQTFNTMYAMTNGIIVFSDPGSALSLTNRTLPSPTATIRGVLAPFWGDLELTLAPGAGIYAGVFSNRTIVQWKRNSAFTSGAPDDLNFEVKFFDDGRIEIHFGTMISGSTSNRATGNAATVWLEKPDGTAARAISINQPLIAPNTAYRFTPRTLGTTP